MLRPLWQFAPGHVVKAKCANHEVRTKLCGLISASVTLGKELKIKNGYHHPERCFELKEPYKCPHCNTRYDKAMIVSANGNGKVESILLLN